MTKSGELDVCWMMEIWYVCCRSEYSWNYCTLVIAMKPMQILKTEKFYENKII